VEHLLSALAGLHVRSGVRIEVIGGEVPLLDGGARELGLGLRALAPSRAEPPLRITRSETIEIGASRYHFAPGDRVELEVSVDFAGVGKQSARHDGDPSRFLQHIAPARTFGFEREAEELERSGRARWVDPHVVLVLDDEGRARPPAAPPGPNELARHKLLDLMGDLYLFGGPPIGRISAELPGHGASHAAAAQALERGVIAPIRGAKTAGN
jgi:UDP-3-O-[3-hydroxymyristoyl] N-acetylglucosamine deacetylase